MIDRTAFLAAAQKMLARLVEDLRTREAGHGAALRKDHAAAKEKGRTAEAYASWLEERLTQIAASWVLSAVFVRFLEDNDFIAEALIAGRGKKGDQARAARDRFFEERPTLTDRDYLGFVFDEIQKLPGMASLFRRENAAYHLLGPTGEGAKHLLDFFRAIDPETGELAFDFTDPTADTRFLGDLYQDLSEDARKRYALLQTPLFVEEFILDRTLEPAILEFGLEAATLIDPACGSGHFLLGAFTRLFERFVEKHPTEPRARTAQRALDLVAGTDVNPFAIAIARFRLVLAALRAAGISRLSHAFDFRVHVAAGDSLLHGRRPEEFSGAGREGNLFADDLAHVYDTEDSDALAEILGKTYAAVVGNPPYIVPRDAALNRAYRTFGSCSGKYSLAVPFTERFFDLAHRADDAARQSAGFVGMITANSFMKREFGKKIIEEYFPKWDLTHVIDTSGAYIPGHGTPTVILFARHRAPVKEVVRAVMGIRGEPSTPDDAAKGLVWSAIVEQVDRNGSESAFISTTEVARERFHQHPWSLGGGGAAELKERIESAADIVLDECSRSIGFASFTGSDDAFVASHEFFARSGMSQLARTFVFGESVRDWMSSDDLAALVPYDVDFAPLAFDGSSHWGRHLWRLREIMEQTISFAGKTREENGDLWWTWYRWVPEKYRTPLSITFAEVATHNHFVLDRGGKVFKQTAPVIKLPPEATEEEHLGLLGLLNSSTACFWIQQVCHNKGGPGGACSKDEKWHDFFQLNGTKVSTVPIPAGLEATAHLARMINVHAREREWTIARPLAATLAERECRDRSSFRCMIALQEELDWQCYRLYKLLDEDLRFPSDDVPEVALGERAFEIVLARKVAKGEIETQWFARHRSTPITEIPTRWPKAYQDLVARRIAVIETDRDIALIERPECKRRWADDPWEVKVERALRGWLLDRLENLAIWNAADSRPHSCAEVAELLRSDREFLEVTELYQKGAELDLAAFVRALVEDEGVPYLSAWRYTDAGLRKRAVWEETWRLQREEDRLNALTPARPVRLDIPVPPKYDAKDFKKQSYWRHRGKLDVAKERFILFPGAERPGDPTLVFGWAGWDEKVRTQAIYAFVNERRERDGWGAAELTPFYAGLMELLPWLLQWHDQPEPGEREGFGTIFSRYFDEDLRGLELTREALSAWRPDTKKPKTAKAPRAKKAKS